MSLIYYQYLLPKPFKNGCFDKTYCSYRSTHPHMFFFFFFLNWLILFYFSFFIEKSVTSKLPAGYIEAMKYGHGTRGVAPVSDTATHEGRRCLHVGPCHATWFFLADSHQRGSDLGRFTLNRANSGCIGQKSRFRRKFKKKNKKKVQNAPFELNIKPYFSSLHTNTPNFSYLPLSQSVTRLSLSLCSLPLSLLAVRHSASVESSLDSHHILVIIYYYS